MDDEVLLQARRLDLGSLDRERDPLNNALAFPAVFRGALDVRASAITSEMELAAAHALAPVVEPDHLEPDYVIPSVFDRRVAPAVAEAVAEAATAGGVARRVRE